MKKIYLFFSSFTIIVIMRGGNIILFVGGEKLCLFEITHVYRTTTLQICCAYHGKYFSFVGGLWRLWRQRKKKHLFFVLRWSCPRCMALRPRPLRENISMFKKWNSHILLQIWISDYNYPAPSRWPWPSSLGLRRRTRSSCRRTRTPGWSRQPVK